MHRTYTQTDGQLHDREVAKAAKGKGTKIIYSTDAKGCLRLSLAHIDMEQYRLDRLNKFNN